MAIVEKSADIEHFHQLRKFYWTMLLYGEGPVIVYVVAVLFFQSTTDSFWSILYSEISLQATMGRQERYLFFGLKQLENWKNYMNIYFEFLGIGKETGQSLTSGKSETKRSEFYGWPNLCPVTVSKPTLKEMI